jgi:integrase
MKEKPNQLINKEDDESVTDYYLDWLSTHKEPNTVQSARNATKKLERFASKSGYEIEEMGEPECLEFLQWLDDNDDLCGFTASMYAHDIKRMVDYYHTRGYFAYNPVKMALEEFNFSTHKHPNKEKIPINTLRRAISQTKIPISLVIILLLLKTGIRRSELYNLDLRDIHLDHNAAMEWMPEPRKEIATKPDTIFIDSSISKGDVVNGRERVAGNKPNSTRSIPLDKETKDTLLWWIGMRAPSRIDGEPVLTNYKMFIGRQFSYDNIYTHVTEWGERYGLRGEDTDYHIVPHWCRHWFTTKLRENVKNSEIPTGTADGYIGGLRGDSADGVLDLYTHDWQEEDWIAQVYRDNIPKLFTGDQQ